MFLNGYINSNTKKLPASPEKGFTMITQDFHIHTHCSCDSACARIPDIVEACKSLGFKHFGISDHLHTSFNLPDIEIARKEFLEFGPVPGFHFGVEATCATAWECEKIAKRDYASCFTCTVLGKPFQTMTPIDGIMYGGPAGGPLQVDLTKEDLERLGLEYVIGGVHKPNYTEHEPNAMRDDLFNQACYLVKHELVDILAHPWEGLTFWSGDRIVNRSSPMDFTLYYKIPQEYWDELAHLLISNKKLAELNGPSIINYLPDDVRPYYMEKMAEWRDKGVKFTFGSDLHKAQYRSEYKEKMEKLLVEYGFSEADFGLPPRLKM